MGIVAAMQTESILVSPVVPNRDAKSGALACTGPFQRRSAHRSTREVLSGRK